MASFLALLGPLRLSSASSGLLSFSQPEAHSTSQMRAEREPSNRKKVRACRQHSEVVWQSVSQPTNQTAAHSTSQMRAERDPSRRKAAPAGSTVKLLATQPDVHRLTDNSNVTPPFSSNQWYCCCLLQVT